MDTLRHFWEWVTGLQLLRRLLVPYESQMSLFAALDICVKMVIAVALSGIIGWEREQKDQPAGLRTHIILCVGATMITIVSIHIVADLGGVEPTRIMAQIVSGIGFLGAGAILRLGMTVRGLTTATTLWAIAGVGMAVGAGYYLPAFIAVLTMYVVLHYFDLLTVHMETGRNMHVSVIVKSDPGRVGEVEHLLESQGLKVRSLRVHARPVGGQYEIEGLVKLPASVDPAGVVEALLGVEGTTEAHLN